MLDSVRLCFVIDVHDVSSTPIPAESEVYMQQNFYGQLLSPTDEEQSLLAEIWHESRIHFVSMTMTFFYLISAIEFS